jgi:hypothetical protein
LTALSKAFPKTNSNAASVLGKAQYTKVFHIFSFPDAPDV